MKYIDLHIHTTYSDGSFTPRQAVQYAKKLGLAAIAIADHDTTDGLDDAIEQGILDGIEVVPGVELNIYDDGNLDREIHLLGYYIDWRDREFQGELAKFRDARKTRAIEITDRLRRLGIDIDINKVFGMSKGGAVGRMHFARILAERGVVNSITEAFEQYLALGRPAYVPKYRLNPEQGIRIITNTGGIPVIAHPIFGGNSTEVIEKLAELGLAGIEIYHSRHLARDVKELKGLAERLNLLITGGTDCHGPLDGKEPRMGSLPVPYKILEELKAFHQSNRS